MSRPELRFRLPGRWFSVDLSSEEATRSSIRTIAREAIGPADDRAPERARVRQQLQQAAEAGDRGGARAIMFSTEITPGTPLPVTLVVFEPDDLRMSPAIGTSADAVLKVMGESLKQIDPAAYETMAKVRGPGVPALRTHRVDLLDEGQLEGIVRLVVDYWIPVPDSKHVLMVRFSTPLGELENVMRALFDEFIAVAYFSAGRPESLRDQLLPRR